MVCCVNSYGAAMCEVGKWFKLWVAIEISLQSGDAKTQTESKNITLVTHLKFSKISSSPAVGYLNGFSAVNGSEQFTVLKKAPVLMRLR